MWWLAIPPSVAVGAYVVKKLFGDEEGLKVNNKSPYYIQNRCTPLEENFQNLEKLLFANTSVKRVAIIGQPGAGKSSMLTRMTENQCIPLPIIGQKTDATNWHIVSNSDFFNIYENIKFVDAPGYDTDLHPVDTYLKYFPFAGFNYIIMLIKDKIYGSDERIFSKMKQVLGSSFSNRIILVKSFADYLSDQERSMIKSEFDKKFALTSKNIPLIFLSNRFNCGINEIKSNLSI